MTRLAKALAYVPGTHERNLLLMTCWVNVADEIQHLGIPSPGARE
jgi:hypothetical protein